MAQAVEIPETVSAASGATDVFPTVWTFEKASEVHVAVGVDGVWTDQVQGVDYDVAAGDWLNAGADVVFRAGRRPAAGAKVARSRRTAAAQPEQFGSLSVFLPEQAEASWDRAVRMVQEIKAQVGRAVTVAPGDTPPSTEDLAYLAGAGERIQEALDASTAAESKAQAAQAAVVGVDRNKGAWDALNNTPALAAGVGAAGDYYIVTVAGARDVEAPTDPDADPVGWAVGDRIQFDGARWNRIAVAQASGRNLGAWNALDNLPVIAAGVGVEGDFFTVTVAGVRDIEAPADPEADPVAWRAGDQVLFKDGAWTRVAAQAAGGRNLGGWDAATNTPAITAGAGVEGDFYTVTVEGARDIEAPADGADPVAWRFGDQVRFVDGAWTRTATAATPIEFQRAAASARTVETLAFVRALDPVLEEFAANMALKDGAGAYIDKGPQIQAWLNAAKGGIAQVRGVHYVNTPVEVPEYTTLLGASTLDYIYDQAGGLDSRKVGALVFGPNGRLTQSRGSVVDGMVIYSVEAMTRPTTLAQNNAAVASWRNVAAVLHTGHGAVTKNCTIVGFGTGVNNNGYARFRIVDNKIDCHTGVKTLNVYDLSFITGNIFNALYTPQNLPGLDRRKDFKRTGPAVDCSGNFDGVIIAYNLSYGHAQGIRYIAASTAERMFASRILHNWIDTGGYDPTSPLSSSAGTYGIQIEGGCRMVLISGNHVDSMHTSYSLKPTKTDGAAAYDAILFRDNTAGQSFSHHIEFKGDPNGGGGVISGFMCGGRAETANILALSDCGFWRIQDIHISTSLAAQALVLQSAADRYKIDVEAGTFRSVGSPASAYSDNLWDTSIRAYKSTAQTIAGGNVETLVGFNQKPLDALGEFSTGTYKFTPKRAGVYRIEFNFSLQNTSGAAAAPQVRLRVNGAAAQGAGRVIQQSLASPGTWSGLCSATLALPAGAEVDFSLTSSQEVSLIADYNSLHIYRVRKANV